MRHAPFDVEVYDLRPERARKVDGVIVGHEQLPGDPAGYVKVDLGRHPCSLSRASVPPALWLGVRHERDSPSPHCRGARVPDLPYGSGRRLRHQPAEAQDPQEDRHDRVSEEPGGDQRQQELAAAPSAGDASQGGDQFADDGMRHRHRTDGHGLLQAVVPAAGSPAAVVARP